MKTDKALLRLCERNPKKTMKCIFSTLICGALLLSCASTSIRANAEPMQSENITIESGAPVTDNTDPEHESTQSETNAEDTQQNNEINFNPLLPNDGYSSILYNNMNGLPTSEANAIIQASDGFIWIGSYGGLVRYDGNTFERMDTAAKITSIRSLFEDSKNRLWIGTTDRGIVMMERGEFRYWNDDGVLSSSSVLAIAEDGDGLIYIGTQDGLATIGSDMELTLCPDERVGRNNISELKKGADGLIYGLTHKGDLFIMKEGKVNYYVKSEECLVSGAKAILPDPYEPGKLYIATFDSFYHGTLETDFKDLEISDIDPLNNINSLEFVDGNIWACSVGGAAMMHTESEQFTLLEDVPMDNSFEHVIRDYQGNYWFTSSRQGVMKIVPNQFFDVTERWNLDHHVVNTTCFHEGYLYIGTDTGMEIIGESEKLQELQVKTDYSGKNAVMDLINIYSKTRIRSMSHDSQGRLWICDWGRYGLSYLKDGKITFIDDLESRQVRNICELKDGTIAAAINGGMVLIKDNEVIRWYDESDGIVNGDSLNIAAADNGDIILGSDGGGISVINGDNVMNISKSDGLRSGVIMRIKHDRTRDLYWIASGNSIAYMTPDYKITTVTTFPSSNNFDLYQNSKDEMWILSGSGIYVIPTEEMIGNNIKKYTLYGIPEGLPYIATANSYSDLLEDGTLIISGNNGVAMVNIEYFKNNNKNLKGSIPFIDADGKRLYPDENGDFHVSSDVRKITIYSYVFNYSL